MISKSIWWTGSENVTERLALTFTPVSPSDGSDDTTVGGVLSTVDVVVNDQLAAGIVLPVSSWMPSSSTVYTVPGSSSSCGATMMCTPASGLSARNATSPAPDVHEKPAAKEP
jgi:hypothetical protein